jgi:hypothetical protein
LEKLKHLLEEKNTYMNYYKKEEIKQEEKVLEGTKSKVKVLISNIE